MFIACLTFHSFSIQKTVFVVRILIETAFFQFQIEVHTGKKIQSVFSEPNYWSVGW